MLTSAIGVGASGVICPFVLGYPLDPTSFAPLGVLQPTGAITINTDTLQITGAATFTGVDQPQTGGSDIAVFCFSNIDLRGSANVTVTGSKPLALLSTTNATIDVNLSVDAGAAQESPGPGASAKSTSTTGGGGFGGQGGGTASGSGPGPAYANLYQVLQSGSDAGNVTLGPFDVLSGGRGGGALEIDAVDNLSVGGKITANGGVGSISTLEFQGQFSYISTGSGSGGAIFLHAGQQTSVGINNLSARGGDGVSAESIGGPSGVGGAGGGGGAIVEDAAGLTFDANNPGIAVSVAMGNVSGGSTASNNGATSSGDAGVITLIAGNTTVNSAQSYSGLAVAQQGSNSQNTPTILVAFAKTSITATGTLTQGCDQLILPGSPLSVLGSYDLGGFAQTLGQLQGSGSVNLRNGSNLTLNFTGEVDTFNGTFTESSRSPGGGGSFTKSGVGKLILGGVNTYTGPTNVLGGRIQLTPTASISDSFISVGNGSGAAVLEFLAGANGILTRTVAGLSIAAGATVKVDSASSSSNRSVLITPSPIVGGTLDLTNNDMIVHNTNLSTIRNLLNQGYNNGGWNGASGILSSSAAASTSPKTALGYTSGSPLSVFDTQPITATDIAIQYTLAGDTNLDDSVNFTDLLTVAQHYNATATTWTTGDVNYDNTTNFTDLLALAQNYNKALPLSANQLANLDSVSSPGFTTAWAQAQAQVAVPEPQLLYLLSPGVALLSRRRRRCISR